uniref:Solute carrier family 17 member 9a n=1 Tax=Salarias fasciatus TaxID=181472 RepID=A0A672IIG8_SALFA
MVMLFIGTCLLYCARMAMPICAVTLAVVFQWSKIDSGLALGGFFWGYCVTQVLGGHASDKIGGERVLFISTVSWTLITAATPLLVHLSSHTLAVMTGARFLMGVLQGVFFPSLASLCSQRVVKGDQAFLMSAMHSGSALGTLLAGGIGSLMLDRFGWESVFYCTGFLSSLWTLVVWLYLINGKMDTKTNPQPGVSRTPWLSLFKKPNMFVCAHKPGPQLSVSLSLFVRAMVVAHMCMCSTSFVLLSWLPTYFKETFPHAQGWVYNVIPWAIAIPSAICGGYFSDFLVSQGERTASVIGSLKCEYLRPQFIAMGVSSMFLIILAGSVSFPTAVTLVSMSVGTSSLSSSGVSVNVQDLTPSCAGALYGFMNTMGAFSGLVLVSLSGYLIEVSHSWATVFSLIILVNTLGLVVFLIFGDAHRVDLEDYSPVNVI